MKFSEQFHHRLSIGGIQIPSRFVGKQDGRIADQRARNGDALLLAARELRRIARRQPRRKSQQTHGDRRGFDLLFFCGTRLIHFVTAN